MAKKPKATDPAGNGKRKHRAPDVVIAEMEARLARAKARLEHRALTGTPAVKALQAARSGMRRMLTVDDPEEIFEKPLLKEMQGLLDKLDAFAVKYGARVRQEEAA